MISSVTYSQKPLKSVEQQAKEFLVKLKTMNPSQQRQTINNLVYSLNNMDQRSKGIWLAALASAEPKKVAPTPKPMPLPMTPAEIESNLIEKTKELITNPYNHYFVFNPKYAKLKSITIKHRVSDKEIADVFNARLQKKMDSISAYLIIQKSQRALLKKELPENYEEMGTEERYNLENAKDLNLKYLELLQITNNIKQNTRLLIDYPDSFRKGKLNYSTDWDNESKTHFIIEVTTLPIDGLDDTKPELHGYLGNYYPIVLSKSWSNPEEYYAERMDEVKVTEYESNYESLRYYQSDYNNRNKILLESLYK